MYAGRRFSARSRAFAQSPMFFRNSSCRFSMPISCSSASEGREACGGSWQHAAGPPGSTARPDLRGDLLIDMKQKLKKPGTMVAQAAGITPGTRQGKVCAVSYIVRLATTEIRSQAGPETGRIGTARFVPPRRSHDQPLAALSLPHTTGPHCPRLRTGRRPPDERRLSRQPRHYCRSRTMPFQHRPSMSRGGNRGDISAGQRPA